MGAITASAAGYRPPGFLLSSGAVHFWQIFIFRFSRSSSACCRTASSSQFVSLESDTGLCATVSVLVCLLIPRCFGTEGAVSAGGLYNPSKSVGPLEACWALQPLPDMQNTPASNKLAYMIFITTLRAQKDGTKFPPPRRAGPQVETGGLAKVSMVDHSSFNRLSRNRRSRSERYRRLAAGSDIFTLSDRVGLLRWLALARTAALSWLWCP